MNAWMLRLFYLTSTWADSGGLWRYSSAGEDRRGAPSGNQIGQSRRLTARTDGQTVTYSVYVALALCTEPFAMRGLLVTSRAQIDEQQMRSPILPAFVRRALRALFRRP